jgi:hypothetical protein
VGLNQRPQDVSRLGTLVPGRWISTRPLVPRTSPHPAPHTPLTISAVIGPGLVVFTPPHWHQGFITTNNEKKECGSYTEFRPSKLYGSSTSPRHHLMTVSSSSRRIVRQFVVVFNKILEAGYKLLLLVICRSHTRRGRKSGYSLITVPVPAPIERAFIRGYP